MTNIVISRPVARSGGLALTVILSALFLAQFDLYVVNIALPVLSSALHASDATLQLIAAGYAFTYASGLIIGGRLGDHLGHRRVFTLGLIAFGVTSLLCGLAQTDTQLVLTRLAQGLSAAAMVPQVLALITASFPPHQRGSAMAWYGVVIGAGAISGQVLGGALLSADLLHLGWRSIFLINVPISLIAAALTRAALPLTPRPSAPTRLDPTGLILLTLGLGLFLLPLILGRLQHWPSWVWGSLTLALPVLTLGLQAERRAAQLERPSLLPLSLFRHATFRLGLLISVTLFAAFFSLVFCLTLTIQSGLNLDPLHAGLTFAPLGVAFATASLTGRTLITRFGPRVMLVGSAVALTGLLSLMALLTASPQHLSPATLALPLLLLGLGNGTTIPLLIGAVLADIPAQQAGAASGVLVTTQQFASAAGIAGIGNVFFSLLGTSRTLPAYLDALQFTVLLAAILVTLAASLLWRLTRRTP